MKIFIAKKFLAKKMLKIFGNIFVKPSLNFVPTKSNLNYSLFKNHKC